MTALEARFIFNRAPSVATMQEQPRNSHRFATTSLFLPACRGPSYDKSPICFHDRVKRARNSARARFLEGDGTPARRSRPKAIRANTTACGEVKKVVTR